MLLSTITMSSNRDFARKRSWDKYSEATQEIIQMMIDTTQMDDDQFSAYREALKTFYTSWYIFKEVRPVTAHILEELFGEERAKEHFVEVSKFFTEEKAVSMIKYVKTVPKIEYNDDFERRINLLANEISEEE